MLTSTLLAFALLSTAQADIRRLPSDDGVQRARVAFTATELSGARGADTQVRAKLAQAASHVCLGEAQARSGRSYAQCRRTAFNDAVRELERRAPAASQ